MVLLRRDTPGGNLTAIVYHPIFVPDVDEGELFGMDRGPSDCVWASCFDKATRTKWWVLVNSCLVYSHGRHCLPAHRMVTSPT